jgi:hypothetical protein
VTTGRQDDDRCCVPLPQPLRHVEAVDVRKPEVEENEAFDFFFIPPYFTFAVTAVERIEDESQLTRFLRRSLAARGYRTVEAGAGEEGLRLASQYNPDHGEIGEIEDGK